MKQSGKFVNEGPRLRHDKVIKKFARRLKGRQVKENFDNLNEIRRKLVEKMKGKPTS